MTEMKMSKSEMIFLIFWDRRINVITLTELYYMFRAQVKAVAQLLSPPAAKSAEATRETSPSVSPEAWTTFNLPRQYGFVTKVKD